MYIFNAYVTRVIDGDTFEARVDLGFKISFNGIFRLNGIDTPETWRPKSEAERAHGEAATKFVESCILHRDIKIKTYKSSTSIYGRYSCDVTCPDGRDLVHRLIKGGFEKQESYEDIIK